VIAENPRAFREPLSRLELAYAREITEVANQWAHLEPFSDADASRALDTMVRLLRAAAADTEAREVGTLLARHHPSGLPVGDNGAHDDDIAEPGGSAVVLPATYREASGSGPASGDTTGGGEVAEFRDRDGDYQAWMAAHGSGYVINIGRSGRGNAALHRAGCGTITNSASSTRSFMKVCSDSLELLDAWALQRNGAIAPRCRICHPPQGSTTAAQDGPQDTVQAVPPALPAARRRPLCRSSTDRWPSKCAVVETATHHLAPAPACLPRPQPRKRSHPDSVPRSRDRPHPAADCGRR
jgi:hypothetical protein